MYHATLFLAWCCFLACTVCPGAVCSPQHLCLLMPTPHLLSCPPLSPPILTYSPRPQPTCPFLQTCIALNQHLLSSHHPPSTALEPDPTPRPGSLHLSARPFPATPPPQLPPTTTTLRRPFPLLLTSHCLCRLCWSLTTHTSSWDLVQCINALSSLQGGKWLPALLSKMDRAIHDQPHNRSHYAAAWDLIKLALLQNVADDSAQAVCQVWSPS